MHGNGLLFRSFLILVVSSAILMRSGISIGQGANGTIVWPFVALSIVVIAAIAAYAIRLRRGPQFTNKPMTMLLLTLSGLSCLAGIILSVVPL